MICHSCQNDALTVVIRVDREGVPPGTDGHDITYSHAVISSCGTCRGSEIEIHAHDCFDQDDVFDHYDWYVLGPAETAQLLPLIERCPDRLSADCGCRIHEGLRPSCRSLPSSAGLGRWGIEVDFHVHRAYLDVEGGVPRIATERKSG